MDTSLYLARIIGPIFLLLLLAVLIDRTRLTVAAREHLASPAMILLSALLSLTAGLAIVNSHPVWTADWRGLITLTGWFLTLVGAVRLVMPRLIQRQGNGIMNRVWPMWVGVAVVAALGVIFTWAGYFG